MPAAQLIPKGPADRSTQYMRVFITVALLLIYGGVIYTLMYREVKLTDAVGNLLLVLLGILTREISVITSFNFSSTAGSQEKDDTIRQQARTQEVVATTAAATVAAGTGATNGTLETAAWNEALSKNTVAAYDEYLVKFPTGTNAPEARARIAAKGGSA